VEAGIASEAQQASDKNICTFEVGKCCMQFHSLLRDEVIGRYLLVSHDLNVVRLLCDRVIVMRSGRIEQGPSELVLGDPEHAYTRELLTAIPHPPLPVH
jgi:ABC-type microcin C transport system duplicated ATPase subunit YejF